MSTVYRITAITAVLALTCACADYEMSGDRADTDYDDTGWGASEDQDSDNDGWDSDDEPPEQEDDFLALLPAQTDVFVFIANPGRGTVTRVNVFTLDVQTTPVGREPTKVITTPDYSTAVAFNKGDDTVSIIDALTLDTVTVEVRDNFNNMVMSPDGRWVGIWHDQYAADEDDPPAEGLQSFNEVSFVNLETYEHFPMAVDYNPRQIKFTDDSDVAVVVSDESLALVDLQALFPYPVLVPVAEDPLNPARAEEIAIAPDGTFAFVRQFGAQDIVIVDLLATTVDRVPVGSNPTDLDITPDGTKAVVVSRGSKELYVFDVADPFAAPQVLDLPVDVTLGSVTIDPIGHQAILYTTASLETKYATWDLVTDEIVLRNLVKPVRGMAITPTGGTLLVFHTLADSVDTPTTSPFYGSWALTMLDLATFRANPLRLPAEPIGYANSQSGERGYFVMEGVDELEELDYRTLLYNPYPIRSNPVYIGVLPDLDTADNDEPPVWVSQEHDLGRISFFDPDEQSMETITGFELNSQIEE